MKIGSHLLLRHHSLAPAQTSLLQQVIQTLQDPPNRRREPQLLQLASFLSHLKFFNGLDERTEVVRACCKQLTHEAWQKGDVVFRKGDPGDKFYIILAGTLGVYINTTVTREVQQDNGIALLKSSFELQEVKEIREGETFGELALITNSTRAATVQCKSDCHLAVLDKAEYLRLLGKLEQQKLQELVNFLQSLPLFRDWGKMSTQRVSYYFTPVSYIRKQVVYRSQDTANYVYIVKQGEFELSQNVTKSLGKLQTAKHFFHQFAVSVLGKGEVFGHSEVMQGVPRQHTCTCTSATGLLLVISKSVPIT